MLYLKQKKLKVEEEIKFFKEIEEKDDDKREQ